jgi:uncharacterized protein (DUF302 family)
VTKSGLVQVTSEHSFADTVSRLESTIGSRGLTIFAKIDFGGDAERSGLKMNPTQLLIFGNPKVGTPLMLASPTLAIDFPLKVLVSENPTGKVWVSYNSLEYLKSRHNIPENLLKNIAGIESIVQTAVGS